MQLTKTQLDFFCNSYERAPGVRRVFDQAGIKPKDIQTYQDLELLPVTRKKDLMSLQKEHPPFGGFVSADFAGVQRIFISPGPLFDPQGTKRDFWRWGTALKTAGFGKNDVVLNTFSYHLTPAGFMFDAGLRKLGAVVIPAGVGEMEVQVRLLHQLKITGYVGLPSYLIGLIKKAQEMGYNFPGDFNLRKAFVTAEKMTESMRRTFSREYGITVFQGYGTADVGCMAYECAPEPGMVLNDEIILEIVHPETGRQVGAGTTGEIVVTLVNKTYPLIRFATGDLSAFIFDDDCTELHQQVKIKGVLGRVGDGIKVRGLFVYPHQIIETMGVFPEVTKYQALVERNDHKDYLKMKVEIDGTSPPDALVGIIQDKLKAVLRVTPQIDVVPMGSVPAGSPVLMDTRTWE